MKKLGIMGLLLFIGILIVIPVAAGSNLHHDLVTVERGDAESVDVEITMGAGELTVTAGADELLEAEFIYNREDWKPEVEYDINHRRGRLKVSQPSGTAWNSFFNLGNTYYEWNLKLNNELPMDLDIKLGAGEANLQLGNLALSRLDVKLGVGDVTIDLTGEWKEDCRAYIIGGVGEAVIKLPADAGIRVEVQQGIGSVEVLGLIKRNRYYVNELYGKAAVNLEVNIRGGIGEIQVELVD